MGILKRKQSKYYSLNNILEKNADYNVIFGERSNGKTYAALLYGVGVKIYGANGRKVCFQTTWQTV